MTLPLTDAERVVALVLYRHGGGRLDDANFQQQLEADPRGQLIARAVASVLGSLMAQVGGLITACLAHIPVEEET